MVMSHGGSAVHLRSGPTRRASGPIPSVSGIRSESHDICGGFVRVPDSILRGGFVRVRVPDSILRGDLSESESRTRYSAADLSESESRTRYSAQICPSPSPPLGDLVCEVECMPWRRFVVILCIWNVIWSACFGLFLERRSKPIGVLSADCDRLPIDRASLDFVVVTY